MKKLLLLTPLILIGCSTTQKEIPKREINKQEIIKNYNFDKNVELPSYVTEELERQGHKTYTVGVLRGEKLTDRDYIFKDNFFVNGRLYTYSTQNFEKSKLYSVVDENRMILPKVIFSEKSTINMRVNTSRDLYDYVEIQSMSNTKNIYINIENSGIDARFSKIPLLKIPRNITTNFILKDRILVNNVEYVLEVETQGKYKVVSIAPRFANSDIAFRYRERELEKPIIKENPNVLKTKKNPYIREKITIFIDKEFIGNSNIIDVVER